MTVFLFDKKRRVELTLREFPSGVVNWNLPMNSNDFRVFKDVQNDIEFVVRNADRKPVNMMGRTAKVNFFDQKTSQLLFQQELKVIDEAKGICKLILLPDVTADWFLQTYSYSVQVTNVDGSTHMLYMDTFESQTGFFELAQGPIFDPQPSVEIPYEALSLTNAEIDGLDTSIRVSSALEGSLQRNNTSGVHTLVAFLDNFSGHFKIQGSLEPSVPTELNWFDIEVREYDHQTSTEAFTFEGNFMWVRVYLINKYEQLEFNPYVLPADEGKITKLVFRN
jgi:hypothetical protein